MDIELEELEAGLRRLLLGDARGATELLALAARALPDEPVAHHALAVAQRLVGDLSPAGAIAAARRAVTLAPGHPVVLTHLALLQWMVGQGEEARFTLDQVIAEHPSHRVARYYRGLLHREAGRLREAVDDLEAAAAPGPGALPGLSIERIHGQLFDTRRVGHDRVAPSSTSIAAIAAVTELLLPDGDVQAFGLPPEEPRPSRDEPLPPSACVERTPSEVARRLHEARRVVALTGAGASVDSGLSTRKDLWKLFDRDEAVSAMRAWESTVALWQVVESFLGDGDYAPGTTHHVLSQLPRLDAIITQNVDDLHQRAATGLSPPPVLELHGTLERTRCGRCGADGGASALEIVKRGAPLPPHCTVCKQGCVRPDVVLFGEWVNPSVLAEAVQWVTACDVLLVVGCAMDVAPACDLPRLAARAGATVIEVKRSPSRLSDALGTWWLRGPAGPALRATYEALGALEPLPPLPPSSAGARPPRRRVSVRMPKVGDHAEATVAKWHCKPGDRVVIDAALLDLSLDKADIDLPSPMAGTVVELVAAEGDTVSVGQPLLVLAPDEPAEDDGD